MVEVNEHGDIKITSYIEAVVISKEEQEQALRIFKQLHEENDKLRKLVCELYEDQCCDGDRWKYRGRMRELGIEVEDV